MRGRLPCIVAAVLAAASAARVARADAVTAQLEPAYNHFDTTTTDPSGKISHLTGDQLLQRYRLNLDWTLAPLLRLNAGGLFAPTQTWLHDENGWRRTDERRVDGLTRLDWGGQTLRAGAAYDRRESRLSLSGNGTPTLVRDLYSGYFTWRPEALPSIDVRANRTHESGAGTADLLTNDLSVLSIYAPTRQVELRYNLTYLNPNDRISGTDTVDVAHVARVQYAESLPDSRATVYASYEATYRTHSTSTVGTGNVTVVRPAITGLSGVDAPPATPDRITLAANPALIDGDLSASAGLDIGFSLAVAGDLNGRELGVRFSDAATNVNRLYVWVDRVLSAEVVLGFTWTAYASDDNVTWRPVALAGPVTFGTFQNRFEIPIADTTARFVKVVTKPLTPAVTLDRQYADIFVTELQALLVVPAATFRGETTQLSGTLNTSARVLLARTASLTYDFSAVATHTSDPARLRYDVVNGLSIAQRLGGPFLLTARIDRTDSSQTRGHEDLMRLTSSIGATPFETLTASFTYLGQRRHGPDITDLTNTLLLTSRADLYRGVAVLANASYTVTNSTGGRSSRATSLTTTTELVPHRSLNLNGSVILTSSTPTDAGSTEISTRTGIVQGNVSYSPFTALYLAAGVSRYFWGTALTTLTTLAAHASPFPGGNLMLRANYNETYDSAQNSRTRVAGPGVRWNIRPGTFFDVSYTVNESRFAGQSIRSLVFFADLLITLTR